MFETLNKTILFFIFVFISQKKVISTPLNGNLKKFIQTAIIEVMNEFEQKPVCVFFFFFFFFFFFLPYKNPIMYKVYDE